MTKRVRAKRGVISIGTWLGTEEEVTCAFGDGSERVIIASAEMPGGWEPAFKSCAHSRSLPQADEIITCGELECG